MISARSTQRKNLKDSVCLCVLRGDKYTIAYRTKYKSASKKITPVRHLPNRGFYQVFTDNKLSFFGYYFERNFNSYFLMKFYKCSVVTNFFNLTLNKDNLTIDVMTQFSQFICNLNIAYRTVNNTRSTYLSRDSQRNAFQRLCNSFSVFLLRP